MASTEQLFYALLRSDHIKDHLLPHLSTSDLCAIRRASTACCNLLTKRIFTRVHVTFTANTFTKPTRVTALGRVGHHIEHLTFQFPHSDATFLPPLIHPQTGEEMNFLYTPHTSMGSAMTRPKYANSELGDILTQQYPPLFHAATNVPSFINAFRYLTNVRHLTVRCPGQKPEERYRRDIVDYALISLRIAVERVSLTKLHKISLTVHPAALQYLKHIGSIGKIPSATKRWGQIRKLHMSIEAWDFYGSSPGLDHLRLIDDYIRGLSPNLEKFVFTWLGSKGPCPLAVYDDHVFVPSRSTKKLFHEVTSPMSPLPCPPTKAPIHLPKLRYMQIRNSEMNAPQLKHLIASHRATVKLFDFDNVVLADNGDWDEALTAVNDKSWSKRRSAFSSQATLVASDAGDDLPSPSAAVEAASKELLDLDLNMAGFSFTNEDRGVIENLAEEVVATRDTVSRESSVKESSRRDSGVSFSTTLRKKHRRSRSSKSEASQDTQSAEYHEEDVGFFSSPSKIYKSFSFSKKSFESVLMPSPIRVPAPKPVAAPVPVPDRAISPPDFGEEPPVLLLQPTVYVRPEKRVNNGDSGISPVQRNIEQEEAHRLFAEDADARMTALAKAKEAVISKLSREFSVKSSSSSRKGRSTEAVAACRRLASRDYSMRNSGEVLEDRWTQSSMMIPIMMARC